MQEKAKIYIKLMPNNDKQPGDNRPSWVAPIHPKSPEGKIWRIGCKVGETWYNSCAFDDTDDKGEPNGMINVVLSPNDSSARPPQNKGFASKPTSASNQEYKF